MIKDLLNVPAFCPCWADLFSCFLLHRTVHPRNQHSKHMLMTSSAVIFSGQFYISLSNKYMFTGVKASWVKLSSTVCV